MQPFGDTGERILGLVRVLPDEVLHPLRHVECGRIDRVFLQLPGLALEVGMEVNQALILLEALKTDAATGGFLHQVV